jgi:hypothetical protein
MSRGFAVIVPQHAAKSLAARYIAGGGTHFARIDQSVVEPLVIALCVIMGKETNHGGF